MGLRPAVRRLATVALTVGGLAAMMATTVTPANAAPPIPGGVTYQIVGGSDFCVSARSFTPGRTVIQESCGTATNSLLRHWVPVNLDGEATYRLRNWASGLCLAIGASRTDAGAKAIQWSCGNIADQMWRLTPLGEGFQLVNVNSGLCLTNVGPVFGSELIQNSCSFAVTWRFRPV